jgi:hypothetical protein
VNFVCEDDVTDVCDGDLQAECSNDYCDAVKSEAVSSITQLRANSSVPYSVIRRQHGSACHYGKGDNAFLWETPSCDHL